MRQLQLKTPTMTGPDVFDWQTFLKTLSLFPGKVDSDFGPISDGATRAYQRKADLGTDGVVGPDTLARAALDGYVSTTGSNIAGMDTNVSCAKAADQLSGEGMQFVARYYSDTAAKTLTPDEAHRISGAGISLVAVFENRNNSADLFSTATGKAQAAKALALAAGIGQPAGSAIYFAVDFDAALADLRGGIADYFDAIQNAFSAAETQYAVGVYGSGLTCRVIRDTGLAKFTWLTNSVGFQEYSAFRRQADIVQLFPERLVAGGQVSIDDDIAQSAAFGAFNLAQAQTAAIIAT